MSQFQAQHFYCLKSERTVSGSVLNSQLIYEEILFLRTKDLKVARPHGASVVGNCRVRIFNDDLAYRLIVERPFIQSIRNNAVVFITPRLRPMAATKTLIPMA